MLNDILESIYNLFFVFVQRIWSHACPGDYIYDNPNSSRTTREALETTRGPSGPFIHAFVNINTIKKGNRRQKNLQQESWCHHFWSLILVNYCWRPLSSDRTRWTKLGPIESIFSRLLTTMAAMAVASQMEALLWRVNPREPIPPHIARFITPVFLSVAILSVLLLPGLTHTAVGLSIYNIVALCTNTLDCSSSFLSWTRFFRISITAIRLGYVLTRVSLPRSLNWRAFKENSVELTGVGVFRGVDFIYLEAY